MLRTLKGDKKIETLFAKLWGAHDNARETLGGCLFTYEIKNDTLKIEREHAQ